MCVKFCSECEVARKHVSLLREIVTNKGNKKYYPYLVYPYVSLIACSQSLFVCPISIITVSLGVKVLLLTMNYFQICMKKRFGMIFDSTKETIFSMPKVALDLC